MKTLVVFLSAVSMFFTGFDNHHYQEEILISKAVFSWDKTVHDFGNLKKGNPVSVEFKFQNSGNAVLIINEAKATCGCTVSTFTKEAIAPGKWGKVTVTYDASTIGSFNKTVKVTSTDGIDPQTLVVRGVVVE